MEPRHSGRSLLGAGIAGIATILLTLVALRGLQDPPSGDIVASTAIGTSTGVAVLLVGSLAMLGLELARLARERPSGRPRRHGPP